LAAVTPTGDINVVDKTTGESVSGLSAIQITAADARARRFEFVIRVVGEENLSVSQLTGWRCPLIPYDQFRLPLQLQSPHTGSELASFIRNPLAQRVLLSTGLLIPNIFDSFV